MTQAANPRICFVGMGNLPVLAPEYGHHGNGGEEVQHTLLAQALHARGFDASMVVMDYGQQDGQSWEGITTYKAYRPREGLPVLRFVHPRWTKLWAALRRADADIYYVSNAGALLGQVALFCQRYKRRLVFRIALNSDCDPENLPIQYGRDKRLYRYGLRKTDAILAQTQFQQEKMLANFGYRSRVATMLVDSPKLIRNLEERDIDVLWVSNLRTIKRPDLVLDLAEKMPHRTFHVVGGPTVSSPHLYDDIASRAAHLSNVKFHGRVAYRYIGDLYDRCKVFVNTSDLEGFPNTYLQAWVRGIPVIAFFDPDGLIKSEKLGASPGDLEQMKHTVDEFLNSPGLWTDASQRCRQYMDRAYNPDAILRPYLDTFHALKPGTRRPSIGIAKMDAKP